MLKEWYSYFLNEYRKKYIPGMHLYDATLLPSGMYVFVFFLFCDVFFMHDSFEKHVSKFKVPNYLER